MMLIRQAAQCDNQRFQQYVGNQSRQAHLCFTHAAVLLCRAPNHEVGERACGEEAEQAADYARCTLVLSKVSEWTT